MFCGENLSIHKCQQLKEKSSSEKKKFVLDNQLCFGCLRKGHITKECKKKATCSVCKGRHPTPLHEERPKKDESSIPKDAEEEKKVSVFSCRVREGVSNNTSMVVPVCISNPKKRNKKVYAYALLDAQSDVTFIDQEICKKLQVATEPMKLKLTTMTGRDSLVNSQKVKGPRVRGLHSNLTLNLPPSYTKDDIPLDRDCIPTCETNNKWEHLSVIFHEMSSLKEFGVGLLIGYDCPEALVPRRVITGGKGEPYAVQTDLGWGVVGGKQQIVNSRQVTGLCH